MTSLKIDNVFRTRSLGAAASGVMDQYADGKAAKVWELYIGKSTSRTSVYKTFMSSMLKELNCVNVLDAACGTGVDSVLLLEEGFNVTSADASDKMLKTAHKTRWERRNKECFNAWKIFEANWLTLQRDLTGEVPEGGFDAIICMGNSFSHLPDYDGNQANQLRAITNFYNLLKPGGILMIDHRNYDYILDHGVAPKTNIYYNSEKIVDIKTSVVIVNNVPLMVTLDYEMDVTELEEETGLDFSDCNNFRLSYYPHRLKDFSQMLKKIFGSGAKHEVYADFKTLQEEPNPGFFVHVIHKEAATLAH